MYVLIVEYLLGIKKLGKTVRISPSLPKCVEKTTVSIVFDEISMDIEIDNTGEGEWRLFYQNVRYETDVLMIDVKNHRKKFRLARV
jgi:cellobiose phosphorylase